MLKGVPGVYTGMPLCFPVWAYWIYFYCLVFEAPYCPSEQNLNVSPVCLLLLVFPALGNPLACFSLEPA